jgi:hypothetical protein
MMLLLVLSAVFVVDVAVVAVVAGLHFWPSFLEGSELFG